MLNKEKILSSLISRQGLLGKSNLLEDMLEDSITDVKTFLNYADDEMLPDGCTPAVKELALIRFNRDGTEGILTESQSSGGSTTYSDDIPERIKRMIRRYRRLPR